MALLFPEEGYSAL